jgi:hypothetical protein
MLAGPAEEKEKIACLTAQGSEKAVAVEMIGVGRYRFERQ